MMASTSLGPPEDRLFDVCIVGSGAAGSVVAHHCAALGLEVLILERGDFPDSRTFDEIMEASEPAFARDAKGCWSLSGYPWTSCSVGGGTVFYGGASFRLRRVDFDASGHLGDGDLPVTWPYRYDDLEPYYTAVERAIGVAGDNGRGDGSFPGPATDHHLPPVAASYPATRLAQAGLQLGLKGFPTPLAVLTKPRVGRKECKEVAPCMNRRCENGAKGDALTVFLKELLDQPNVTLLTRHAVERLVRSEPSRVDYAEVLSLEGQGRRRRFRARAFVLAGNAIQSAALLLRSADQYTRLGLGNSSGLVGRGLCFKISEVVEGYLTDAMIPETNHRGPFSTITFTDHYVSSEAPSGLGGMIYENRPEIGGPMREAGRVIRVECLLADQPVRENCVRLSSQNAPIGFPYVVLDYRTHPRDGARLEYMVERAVELVRATGANFVRRIPTGYEGGSCHFHGTLRGGDDPRTSVADSTGRLHDLDNVYAADGAFFPFPGAVNPTLTIQAHALRVADLAIGPSLVRM